MELTPVESKVMRGIARREHKHAVEERDAARVAYNDAHKPAPSTVGWSTKPPKRRKPSATDKQIATDAAAARSRWARTTPHAASTERAIRKRRAEVEQRWEKAAGTPETHERKARNNTGPLARLWLSGAIDAEQLECAVEIAAVAERIGRDVAVATASLETRIDSQRSGDGTFFEKLGQVRREIAYGRWRAQLGTITGTTPSAAVLDMLIGEPVGFTVVATRYRLGNRRARRLLIAALDLWPRIFGGVCKEVDAGVLVAAQAGILA